MLMNKNAFLKPVFKATSVDPDQTTRTCFDAIDLDLLCYSVDAKYDDDYQIY